MPWRTMLRKARVADGKAACAGSCTVEAGDRCWEEPDSGTGVEHGAGDDCFGAENASCSHPTGGMLILQGPRCARYLPAGISQILLATPASAATVFAFVAGAVGNHEHAALGTSGRAFVSIAGLGGGGGDRG